MDYYRLLCKRYHSAVSIIVLVEASFSTLLLVDKEQLQTAERRLENTAEIAQYIEAEGRRHSTRAPRQAGLT